MLCEEVNVFEFRVRRFHTAEMADSGLVSLKGTMRCSESIHVFCYQRKA